MITSLLITLISFDVAGIDKNPLARGLIEKGVALPGVKPVKLPPPLMADGLSAADQDAILKNAADRYPYAQFVRKSDVAPFVMKIGSIEGSDKERKGQAIDFWFVAYGTIKTATNTSALQRLLGGGKSKAGEEGPFLNSKQLEQRKITLNKGAGFDERYSLMNFDLLDKIQISGVGRAVKTVTPHSVISAVYMDDRFAKDAEYPNQWRAISKGGGARDLGPPQPYEGFGGYVKIAELPKPAGALFVEFHLVLSEPHAWFDGKNLLKSKLPLAIQDRVRTFRRQLK